MLTSRRVFTGGLYGFWTTLAKTVRETGATRIAFCQDVKPYKRSEVYPEYKQLSKQRADDDLRRRYAQSMTLVLESIDAAGLTPWGISGFESDDLIGHAVAKYGWRYDLIYAGANDSDLYQLLDHDGFRIFKKDKADVVSRESLWKKLGVTPAEFMLMTALTGTHNDIAGIDGVGEKTALKAVREPAVMRKLRDSHGRIIDRNLSLIKLPHPDFPRDAILPYQAEIKKRALYSYLGRYDIETTGALANALDQLNGD